MCLSWCSGCPPKTSHLLSIQNYGLRCECVSMCAFVFVWDVMDARQEGKRETTQSVQHKNHNTSVHTRGGHSQWGALKELGVVSIKTCLKPAQGWTGRWGGARKQVTLHWWSCWASSERPGRWRRGRCRRSWAAREACHCEECGKQPGGAGWIQTRWPWLRTLPPQGRLWKWPKRSFQRIANIGSGPDGLTKV